MNLAHSKLLTKVEYGSQYQGVNDEYSDHDYMFVVLQDIESFMFSKTDVAKEKNENKYFTPQKFVSVVLNGSYDGLVMLSAQLSQQSDSLFNKEVLSLFNEQKIVDDYYLTVKPKLMMSLCGQFNNFYQKYKNKQQLSAKKLLHMVLCYTRAMYFNNMFETQTRYASLEDVVKLSTNVTDPYVQFFVKHKRYENFDKLANEFKNEFNDDLSNYLDQMDRDMKEFYEQYKTKKMKKFKYEQTLKQKLSHFVLSQYAKELNL